VNFSILGAVLWISFVGITCCDGLAQLSDEGNDDPRGNIHIGTTLASPLNPTAPFSQFGWGVTSGAGYNFTRRHAVIGEFMWTHLFVTDSALAPVRAIAQDPNINGGGNLFAFTGNYRFELRGEKFGTYFIVGGGLYYRTVYLSRRAIVGTSIPCASVWAWWGATCAAGMVPAGQTIGSSNSFAPGGTGGIGFTARIGEAPYRVYVETRYHYAPNKGIDTQLIGVSVGFRY
jgi:hypothetical protein